MPTDLNTIISNLNPKQREAVETVYGPVLVIAGPGTGKTQTLAARIAYLLTLPDVSPRNVLCLTFTESGVKAMRARLLKMIGTVAYQIPVHTYHSFASEVIQTHKDKFPEFAGNPQQLQDLPRIKLLRQIIDEMRPDESLHLRPFSNHYQYVGEVISNIQTVKREGFSPEQFAELVKRQHEDLVAEPKLNKKGEPTLNYQRLVKFAERNVELAEIYQAYQHHMETEHLYDYDDMILKVNACLAADAGLRSELQERHQYLLVDEYQDTNGGQNQMVSLLTQGVEKPNIFAVGDDDQAIYRFQGANIGNILYFTQNYPDAKVITITDNYRSQQNILNSAMQVIGQNQLRLGNVLSGVEKNLTSRVREQTNAKPMVVEHADGEAEALHIAEEIKKLQSLGAKLDEIAVIYRRHHDAAELMQALLRAGIPVQLAAGSDALQELPSIMLMELFNLLDQNPDSRQNLLTKVIMHPYWGIDQIDLFKLTRHLADKNYYRKPDVAQVELWDVIGDSEVLQMLELQDYKAFTGLHTKLMRFWQLAAEYQVCEFTAVLLNESGLLDYALRSCTLEQVNALNSVYSYIKSLNQASPSMKLSDLLADLKLLQETGLRISEQNLAPDRDAVHLLTAHASKGLEFEHVFIAKAHASSWSGKGKRSVIKLKLENNATKLEGDAAEDADVEDERRLFFVAITRAKQTLTISHAHSYVEDGNTREVEPSQFVAELGGTVIVNSLAMAAESLADGAAPESPLNHKLKQLTQPIQVTTAESDYLRSIIKDFKLSASALNEFIECPLKFKYNRLYKIPALPSKYIVLGNATHYALEQWSRRAKREEQTSLEQILSDFAYSLDGQLINTAERIGIDREGREVLTNYYSQYADNFVTPVEVEYNFRSHEVVLPLAEQDAVQLSGKIDKVEWIDQDTAEVKVVDYKTTTPKSANDIKGLTKASDGHIWRQLVFYRLLAELDSNFRPAGKLHPYRVTVGEIDFLKSENGKFRKVALDISASDVEELKQVIAKVMTAIRNLEFHDSESFPLCGNCDFCKLSISLNS